MKNVLIIDDEDKLRKLMARIIELEHYEVSQAENAAEGLKKMGKKEFDVVVCDVKLPDMNGIDLIRELKKRQALCEIIVLTAFGNIHDGVQAIKNGAFDYLTKGDDNNRLVPLIKRAVEKADLAKRVDRLENTIERRYSFENVIGTSDVIRKSVEMGKKVAPTDISVLLTGETGTGKEIFAQSIHYASPRRNKPFVAINCSAFSRDLLESELFGHKAGAFTGALSDKKGLFEEANESTLFLDEIGEMPVDLQAKILRVLETKEFLKIGETKPTKVDVRIIAATNRNLEKEIEKGSFRSDLYYRLSAFRIQLPPLRERKGDIKLFVKEFMHFFAKKTNKKVDRFSDEYLKILENNAWKGNIRELRNIIERSIIMSESDVLTVDCLPLEFQSGNSDEMIDEDSERVLSMSEIEKKHIKKVLEYTKGNKAESARLLGIGIATLYRKIEEYKL